MQDLSQYENKIINGQYKIRNLLNQGSFGYVFIGEDILKGELVAIKVEREEKQKSQTFQNEIKFLKELCNIPNVPKIYWEGVFENQSIIILNLLGKDMSYFIRKNGKISLTSGVLLFYQLLKIIQNIHSKNIIHRDLKPENILTGKDHEENTVYLIDYGISKYYKDQDNKHIAFKNNKSFVGTSRYASIDAHLGQELSRKSDLESLFYVVIYLIKGYLPWQNIQNIQDKNRIKVVGQIKSSISYDSLCKELPQEFLQYIKYVRNLTFEEDPNYDYLQQLISQVIKNMNLNFDTIQYEWIRKKVIEYKSEKRLSVPTIQSDNNYLSNKLDRSIDLHNINKNFNKSQSLTPSVSSVVRNNQQQNLLASAELVYVNSNAMIKERDIQEEDDEECIDEYFNDWTLNNKLQDLTQFNIKYNFK